MADTIQGTPIVAFAILIGFMLIGEIVSNKTKAYIPALLVFVILLMAGTWTNILPKNIIEVPGFTSSWASYIILMFLVDMGSSISIKQFKEQWKTVIIAICTILGVAAVVLTVGTAIYGLQTAAIVAPPIAGGLVAVMEMNNAAIRLGLDHLATLPVLIYVLHCFPAYILMPISLKKHGNTVLEYYKKNPMNEKKDEEVTTNQSLTFVEKVPQSLKTAAFYLFSLAVLAVAAFYTAKLFGNKISPTVFGLFYGVIATRLGLLESGSMKKSNSSGYLMFASMISIFTSLAMANPQDVLSVIVSLVVLILLGLVGIFLGSVISGKILGCSVPFSFAVGLNSLLGFPMNFILTTEAIKAIAKTEDETAYLTNEIMPAMLVAGFITVTIGSTIFASIMVNFL